MADEKYFECGVCGALIKKESGETYFKKGTNAESIEDLKSKNATLQADLERVTEAHNKLTTKKAEGDNGDDGSGKDDSDNSGKQNPGNTDEEFWGDENPSGD